MLQPKAPLVIADDIGNLKQEITDLLRLVLPKPSAQVIEFPRKTKGIKKWATS